MIHALLLICFLLQTPPSESSLSPQAAQSLNAGMEAESRHDFDAAISAFSRAAELAPSSSLTFVRLGNAFMEKHDYAAAIPPLKRAVELSPESPAAHQLLGFALLATGFAAQAIPHLQQVNAYGALGIAQLQSGQPAEAVANLQAALAKSPNDPDLLYYLSSASAALASESLNKLLATAPNSARGHQALAQRYYALKSFGEARKEYETALALRPDLPGLRLELGQVFMATSDWEKAEKEFRAGAKSQPGSAEAAYRLGEVLLQQGKMKEAAEELQRSDSLRPDMPETLYSLGRATVVSDLASAERAFERVTQLEKGAPLAGQAYLALAGIHRKQGKAEQAASDMQEYRRIQAVMELHPATN